MKKYNNIKSTILFIMLIQSIAFAQPSDFGTPYDIDDPDPNNLDKPVKEQPPLPIDTYQWVLLSVGVLYGFSKYKTKSKFI